MILLAINQKTAEKILQTAIELFIDIKSSLFGCIGICSVDKLYIKVTSFGDTGSSSILETEKYLKTSHIKRDEKIKPFLISGTPHFIVGVEFEEFIIAGFLPADEETSRAVVALYGLYHKFFDKHKVLDEEIVDRLLFTVNDWDKKYFANQKLLYLAQKVFKPEMFSQPSSLSVQAKT